MRRTPAQTAACGKSNFIANASCCAVPSRACGWPSMFASAIFSALALRGLDDAQMLVLVHRDPSLTIPLVREFRPRGDRSRLADVERDFRASAIAGRQAVQTSRPPPPSQRHPRPTPEIPGAPPRRRFAQSREHPSGRTRDHRAGLNLTSSLPGLTRQSIAFQEAFSKSMDARVKPGHDECACVDVRKRNSAFPRRDAPKSKLLVLTRCVATGTRDAF